jgi:hypothetical protein
VTRNAFTSGTPKQEDSPKKTTKIFTNTRIKKELCTLEGSGGKTVQPGIPCYSLYNLTLCHNQLHFQCESGNANPFCVLHTSFPSFIFLNTSAESHDSTATATKQQRAPRPTDTATSTGWQNQYYTTKSTCASTNAKQQPESSISCTTTGNNSRLTTTWTDDTSIHPFKPSATQWVQPLKKFETLQQMTQKPLKPDKTVNKTSRRIAQRRAKRHAKKVTKKANLPFQQAQYHITQQCNHNYGFTANPHYSKQINFKQVMTTKPPITYCQPHNLTYHNLCTINKIPPGTKQLLGLNLKYCLSTNHLHQDINKTALKMAYSIRMLYHLKELGINKDNHYEKQIYMKNRLWNPSPAPSLLEDKLTDFEKEANAKQEGLLSKLQKRNLSNLTPLQANALRHL